MAAPKPPFVRESQGPKGDDGDQGIQGQSAYQVAVANGFSGTEAQWIDSLQDNSYVHTQGSASSEWIINHNLGFKPTVQAFNSGSQEVDGEVVHTSINQVRIYFVSNISGFARLT